MYPFNNAHVRHNLSELQCNIDNSDATTFHIMLIIGIVFTILSALISFYLDKISPRVVVRE